MAVIHALWLALWAMRKRLAALTLLLVWVGASSCGPDHPSRPFQSVAKTTTTTTAPPTTTTEPPPPTTTSPPRVRPPRASRARPIRYTVDEAMRQRVIAAIYSYSDWDAARMVRIASCESGLNPWAVNGKHHGIFQIANSTLGLVEEHVALAHQIWVRRGYHPWECRG